MSGGTMSTMLAGKNAVIYGGAGGIGTGVAQAFAREGAKVFLVGRTNAKLDQAASEITTAGGVVDTAVLDAQDEQAVDQHAQRVVAARAPRLAEVAEVPMFFASDRASGLTGSMTNVTSGLVLR
jgi:NAD(P)-dependent dehydrogenase (short-subunit alcohol dehydrogenase family)